VFEDVTNRSNNVGTTSRLEKSRTMKSVIFAILLVAVSANTDPMQPEQKKKPELNLAKLGMELKEVKQGDNPMTRVVELIEGLKAKIEADGKAEQKLYDKFACWCEKTTARKAADIEAGKAKIEELQMLINQLSGKGGTLGAEVEQLKKDIASNIESTKEAQELRQKESTEYLEERTETEQCIGALEHAIKVLTGAGEGRKSSAALQEGDMISVAVGVKEALRMSKNRDTMTPAELTAVQDFVANPAAFYSKDTGAKFSALQGKKNPFGDYAPASTQIQGILKEMYDGFTSSLESANADEATKQKDFEELMETKAQELKSLQSTLGIKQLSDAEAAKLKADSKEELEATKAQLAEDEKFFEETKAACKQKAMDWAERSRMRTEELAGINKAIEILSSEDAQGTFESAHNTLLFVQTGEVNSHHGRRVMAAALARRDRAYGVLKTLAKQHKSLRLASLAANLRIAQIPDGGAMASFAPVITAIDKMIAELRIEEQEDIEHRDWCEANENKLKNQKDDLKYKIGQSEGEIERLEHQNEQLGSAIELQDQEIKATNEEMEEALATRNKETDEFREALKDDTDAVALIAQAIDSLTAFYTNNKIPLGLLAKKKAPEYKSDPDVAPETPGMDKPYGGAKSESTGIIAILNMLKEDLEKEIAEAKKAEEAAAADYAQNRQAAQATLNAQEKKKTELMGQKAEIDDKVNDAEKEISAHKDQHEAKEEEMTSLEPNCEWLKTAFDKRREARKTEIDGLIQAKATLAGAGEESLGMVQTTKSRAFLSRTA